MKKTWKVVVIYDDTPSRELAMNVCDHLVQRFWSEFEFDVSWWPCSTLGIPSLVCNSITRAAEGDLIIFALQPQAELGPQLREWIETWVRKRGDREGALLDLTTGEADTMETSAERHVCLRHAAHRAGMDYLTKEPETISWAIPDSREWYTARADRVSSVLDEILHAHLRPPTLAKYD